MAVSTSLLLLLFTFLLLNEITMDVGSYHWLFRQTGSNYGTLTAPFFFIGFFLCFLTCCLRSCGSWKRRRLERMQELSMITVEAVPVVVTGCEGRLNHPHQPMLMLNQHQQEGRPMMPQNSIPSEAAIADGLLMPQNHHPLILAPLS